MKKTYFLSDAHLGSWAIKNSREQEKRVVQFLDSIKDDAKAIYMLGDMFDFWHEYRLVVPKGFTRFLGKLSELSDRGVELHLLLGNHDLWMKDYLKEECGVTIHREKLMPTVIDGKRFCLAHGDGLDRKDWKYLLLRRVFHNRACQIMFATIHPRWALSLGYNWAKHSRLKHEGKEGILLPQAQDYTLQFARQYVKEYPETDYFLIGHRHIDQRTPLENGGEYLVLGDWIEKFSYAVFDGEELRVEHFDLY